MNLLNKKLITTLLATAALAVYALADHASFIDSEKYDDYNFLKNLLDSIDYNCAVVKKLEKENATDEVDYFKKETKEYVESFWASKIDPSHLENLLKWALFKAQTAEPLKLLLEKGVKTEGFLSQILQQYRAKDQEKVDLLLDSGAQLDTMKFEDQQVFVEDFCNTENRPFQIQNIKKLTETASLQYKLLEQKVCTEFEIALFAPFLLGNINHIDVIIYPGMTNNYTSWGTLMTNFEKFLELPWSNQDQKVFLKEYFAHIKQSISFTWQSQFDELAEHLAAKKPTSLRAIWKDGHIMGGLGHALAIGIV